MKLLNTRTSVELVVVDATSSHYVAAKNKRVGRKTYVDKRDVGPDKLWKRVDLKYIGPSK